ncbi:MAG TPA: hypothetical protein VKE70_16310 [Candidatus Solibacter sp.]|nr:hypothetical protein [Candidatus Solibacter sp.]
MTYYTREALELRLTRMMLTLEPTQRLMLVDDCNNGILRYRGENYGQDLPEDTAKQKAENQLHLLTVVRDEQQRRKGEVAKAKKPSIDFEEN